MSDKNFFIYNCLVEDKVAEALKNNFHVDKAELDKLNELGRLAEIVFFVIQQRDKSKDKVAEALRVNFHVDKEELEKLLRIGILAEYRGIDEQNNGIDFLRCGYRAKILLSHVITLLPANSFNTKNSL